MKFGLKHYSRYTHVDLIIFSTRIGPGAYTESWNDLQLSYIDYSVNVWKERNNTETDQKKRLKKLIDLLDKAWYQL